MCTSSFIALFQYMLRAHPRFPIYARPSKTKLLLQDLIASNAIEAGREIAAAWMLLRILTGVLPAVEKSKPIVVEMLNQLSEDDLSDA